jgi:dephospho-CoA kinase
MSPRVLGLTGSIGMGKTTTAGMFAALGIPVWNADAAVARLYAPGAAGSRAIAGLVPDAVTAEGVDRAALKRAIGADPDLLPRIERAIHPLVAEDRQAFLAEHAHADLVLLDIPLLFETGGEALVDRVLVVSTDPAEQRRRVLARPGADPETFEKLLARQMSDAEKRARADHVIATDTLEGTRAAVEELVARLRSEGEKDA